MTKEQLIAYLDAVCDAESAIQSCTDNIALYTAKKRNIVVPNTPTRPMKATVIRQNSKPLELAFFFSGTYITAAITCFFAFYLGFGALIYVLFNPANFEPTTLMLFSAILALIAPPIAITVVNNKDAERAYMNSTQQADKQYQAALVNYETNLVTYNKTCDLNNAATTIFDTAIQKQEAFRTEAQSRLNHLYEMNILYPSFRNLIAAYQIREYLQMGICETLDGPTGAYAQYMLDVRTERICTSIKDLKDSLVSAIHSLQSTLVHELRVINTNIDEISHSLDENFNKLNTSIVSMQNATSAQLDAHFTEANHHLSVMSQNISSAAHNQYIQQRLQNVDTYLLRAPINPS